MLQAWQRRCRKRVETCIVDQPFLYQPRLQDLIYLWQSRCDECPDASTGLCLESCAFYCLVCCQCELCEASEQKLCFFKSSSPSNA